MSIVRSRVLDGWTYAKVVPALPLHRAQAATHQAFGEDEAFYGWQVHDLAEETGCWVLSYADPSSNYLGACPTEEAALAACRQNVLDRISALEGTFDPGFLAYRPQRRARDSVGAPRTTKRRATTSRGDLERRHRRRPPESAGRAPGPFHARNETGLVHRTQQRSAGRQTHPFKLGWDGQRRPFSAVRRRTTSRPLRWRSGQADSAQ